MDLVIELSWNLADWRYNGISHKFMKRLSRDIPEARIQRFGKSKVWTAEGNPIVLGVVNDIIQDERERR